MRGHGRLPLRAGGHPQDACAGRGPARLHAVHAPPRDLPRLPLCRRDAADVRAAGPRSRR
jgi:hypothetical protein